MEKYLSQVAATSMNARSQAIYMINNYDYLMTFLEVVGRHFYIV
jgi:hypothetical protein